jgi:dipeptidyl aminopeptidase/acylaminoacyl peptidase
MNQATESVSPYGFWKSPITSDLIVAEAVTLVDVLLDNDDVYWIESRPKEAGRFVLVKRLADGTTREVVPESFSTRTRVHEYGGGAVLVKNGTVYFSNDSDQKLYRQNPGGPPLAIGSAPQCRYADGIIDESRDRIITVREDHSQADGVAVNTIVAVAVDGLSDDQILISGNDFYSNPRLSSDGKKLAWLTWNHPNMPWTSSELWTANVTDSGEITSPRKIAGSIDESIFQPEWSLNGTLYFISDRSGWWNLYRVKNDSIEAVMPKKAEFGQAQWSFGMATYGFASDSRVVVSYIANGRTHLEIINEETGDVTPISFPYTEVASVRVNANYIVVRAGAPDKPSSVVKIGIKPPATIEILRRSTEVIEDSSIHAYISIPTLIEFPTGNRSAYGWYYAPYNPDFTASVDELPPLIVKSHGGPTAAASSTLDLRIQYWTSRGYAVVDVDYGGSTGYGREFRNRLYQTWGIVDLEDCTNAARFLCKTKRGDEARTAITGGSAGGYTTLCALVFNDFFKIGASYYGVGDLEALVRDTHKFESHYLDWLVGKYPQEIEKYKARSPINFTERLSVPVIFFQGNEDKIVPPNQAEMMVSRIRSKGLPVGYFLFHGEQHGFRQASNIRRSLDAELYFYATLLVRSGLQF